MILAAVAVVEVGAIAATSRCLMALAVALVVRPACGSCECRSQSGSRALLMMPIPVTARIQRHSSDGAHPATEGDPMRAARPCPSRC